MTSPRDDASRLITHQVMAAAWRENLRGIRERASQHPRHITIPTSTSDLTIDATGAPLAGLRLSGDIRHGGRVVTDPNALLRILTESAPTHLRAELSDAVDGLAQALPRHAAFTTAVADTADKRQQTTTIGLAAHLHHHDPSFSACRFFEPLAVSGHHLHPCARTRLGWNDEDRAQYDLESPDPIAMRFVSAPSEAVESAPDEHDDDLTTLLRRMEPALAADNDRVLIPIHPWQHRHLRRHHPKLFDEHTIVDHPELTIPVSPTASIRTLRTNTGHYLKCSLDIHITSTNRGISPATAHNGPILSRLLRDIIEHDAILRPRVAVLAERAGVSLPSSHPQARMLTALLRDSLAEVTVPGELPIPATALPETSPVSGISIIAELAKTHPQGALDFLRLYADLLVTSTTRLAGRYGIAAEAHLQNCVPTFQNGTPHRLILRDMGGARILLPRLAATGHHPRLHPESVTTTHDPDVMRAKLTYTVMANHLDAVILSLHRDLHLPTRAAWNTVAEQLETADIPTTDREFYTAATLPYKALLTMRMTQSSDHHVQVPNPLAVP